ncbi:MAG TPA: carboxymuconolactone decarboxylase family protein [Beutenbergiaceae bacterium]|nr:carboxymuconolactone decarboxylase family protein [Beutenbergiaceae bacterium]
MNARLDLDMDNPLASKVVGQLVAADRRLEQSALPVTVRELIKIRASQINGCGFCLDMHTKDAMAAGESVLRMTMVAAWSEATVFTDAERAALELTEQGTRIADGGEVSDAAWANAAQHFDTEQLPAIIAQIAVINAFNTVNVISRRPMIDYQPGQFG